MTTELMKILKSRELKISYDESAILVILEIKLQSTSLSVSYAERIRFKEINNIMR